MGGEGKVTLCTDIAHVLQTLGTLSPLPLAEKGGALAYAKQVYDVYDACGINRPFSTMHD